MKGGREKGREEREEREGGKEVTLNIATHTRLLRM